MSAPQYGSIDVKVPSLGRKKANSSLLSALIAVAALAIVSSFCLTLMMNNNENSSSSVVLLEEEEESDDNLVESIAPTAPVSGTKLSGVDVSNLISILPPRLARLINGKADPCIDFHEFACGHWEDLHAELPPDKTQITFAFGRDSENTMNNIRLILDEEYARQQPSQDKQLRAPVPQQLLDYFKACNDLEAVDALGLSPIKDLVDQINTIDNPTSFAAMLANLHKINTEVFFAPTVLPDHEEPTHPLLYLRSGGLGLGSSKYYLNSVDTFPPQEKPSSSSGKNSASAPPPPAKSANNNNNNNNNNEEDKDAKKEMISSATTAIAQKKAYLKLLQNIMILSGMTSDEASDAANDAWAIEFELAAAVHQRDEKGHIVKAKHFNVDSLHESYPHFEWNSYFAARNLTVPDNSLYVTKPLWMAAFDRIVGKYSLPTLKRYILVKLVRHLSPLLSSPYLDHLLEYEHVISGRTALLPRWKKCAFSTRTALPFLLSKTYIERFIPSKTKQVATALVEDIRVTLGKEIEQCEWMSLETKVEAVRKLRKMDVEVGYPSDWEPYLESAVAISSSDYMHNYFRAMEHKTRRDLSQLEEPISRRRWHHVPIIANAYYASGTNSAFIPAGILQDPFYNLTLPAAHNFGAVGSIIGHELTHSLDKSGHHFDAEGRKRSWWDSETLSSYNERSECFADYYDHFQLDGVHVDGFHTLGEDIADVGGAKTAYYAFLLAADLYSPRTPSEHDRRLFWLSYASTRCGVMRRESEIDSLRTSVHPPHEFRLLGTVTQLKEFAEDFQCPIGSPMNPEKKCELW